MNPLLVALIFILLILLIASLLMSIPLTSRKVQQESHTPAEVGLDYKSVYFPSTDGITLSGYWMPAEGSARTIIIMHGYTGSKDVDLKYAPAFHENGFNVLMFDFRAHGRSGGKHTSLGALEVRDVLGAYDFAKQSNSWSVGLLGFSMGGRSALLTAARCKDIAAVVSDGGPLRMLTGISADFKRRKIPNWAAPILADMCLFGASLRLGVNLFWNDPLVLARKIPPTPVLLIHGDLDAYTRFDELDKMLEKSKGNVQLWRVAGARHCEIYPKNPEVYNQRVISFLNDHMK